MEEPKMTKDYHEELEQKIPYIKESFQKELLEKNKQKFDPETSPAIKELLQLEKKTRLSADSPSTSKLALLILELIFSVPEIDVNLKFNTYNHYLTLLANKRLQLSKVILSIIQKSIANLEVIESIDIKTKLQLLYTIKTISNGKLYLELEHARVTKMLANIVQTEEKDNKKAYELMNELQIETIGSMEAKERAEFLLYQTELTILNKDYNRTELTIQKINKKILDSEEMHELKMKYYNLLISFHSYQNAYLNIALDYKAIYSSLSPEITNEKKSTLQNLIIYLLLADYSPEALDIINIVKKDEKELEHVKFHDNLLKLMTKDELILSTDFLANFKNEKLFIEEPRLFDLLLKRISQHNLRIVAKYYSRITMDRLCALLKRTSDELESIISEMVVSENSMYVRIDRPAHIISFVRPDSPNDILNSWSHSIDELLRSIDNTGFMIDKEELSQKEALLKQKEEIKTH